MQEARPPEDAGYTGYQRLGLGFLGVELLNLDRVQLRRLFQFLGGLGLGGFQHTFSKPRDADTSA